jgi:hypothetical protein
VSARAPSRRRLLRGFAAVATGGLAAQALSGCEGEQLPTSPPQRAPVPLLPPPSVRDEDAVYPVQAGEVGVVAAQFPYGHGLRYGVKTDGTETTAEIINWRDSIVGMGTVPDPYGLQHPRCRAVLPAGVIRITKPRALLDLRKGPTLWGYTIEGEGLRLTTIAYEPDTPGPLLFASNRVFGLVLRNLHFAAPDKVERPSDCLVTLSSGQNQFFTFENLGFDGRWRSAVRLSNVPGVPIEANNCEFKFDRINVGPNGFEDAFLVDAAHDELKSGQHLNYWFSNINTTMRQGTLVKLRRGGHVTIDNLDVSGYSPAQESFVIDLPEVFGSDGAHSLIVRNARFEALSEKARFLRCRWERGTVCIDGYDDIVWRNTSHLNFDIRASNAVSDASFGKFGTGASPAGAQYWFANGRFTGVHRFKFRAEPGGDAQNVPATIQYQNCEFCGPANDAAARNIHSFVRLLPDGGKSFVSRPHVRFRACRVEAVPNHVTDWDLGIQGPHASTTAPIKAVKFGTARHGCLPSGAAAAMVLPPGTLVLRATWVAPRGRGPAKPYRFELSDGYEDAARRQVLAVFEGDDFSLPASRTDLIAHETALGPAKPDLDPVRGSTLVLRETRSPGVHPSAQCIVEYI